MHSILRSWIYDIPLSPFRIGLAPLIALTIGGALYAMSIFAWLAVRRLYML